MNKSKINQMFNLLNSKFDKNNLNITLYSIINTILNDDNICNYNKNKSFFHSLGFIKLVLLNLENNSQIRLHLWLKGDFLQTPHTHPWNFKSRILNGQLIDEIYDESNINSKKFNKYQCKSSFIKNGHKFEKLENIYLKTISTNTYKKNDIYSHDFNNIHLTSYTESNTITLCITSKSLTNISNVYSNDEEPIVDNEGQNGLSTESYKEYLNNVLTILKEDTIV